MRRHSHLMSLLVGLLTLIAGVAVAHTVAEGDQAFVQGSAGPQIVTAKGLIEPWDNQYTIQGRKGWHFTPSEIIDDVRKAFGHFVIESAQQQLQAIIDDQPAFLASDGLFSMITTERPIPL